MSGGLMLPGHKKQGASRLQIIGAPNQWKTTTALITLERPLFMIGMPGEKHTDIFDPTPELGGYIFPTPDYSNEKVDWEKEWEFVRTKTRSILDGEYGKYQTIVFDGAHKAFDVCYFAAKQRYRSDNGEWDGRKGWPWVRDEFLKWFSQGYYSSTPWVVWIAWAAHEQDDPLAPPNSKEAMKKSVWPEYSGKFQRTAMGETNIIYQYVEGGRAYWQIRPDDKIKGIGLRVSAEKAVKLPIRIPANWGELKKILLG